MTDYEPKFKAAYASVLAARVTDQRAKSVACTCDQCGHTFYASRHDAKFCSPICRKAASRRKEQMKRMADHAISQINSIKRYAEKFEGLDIFGSVQLDRIREALSVTPAVRTHSEPMKCVQCLTNVPDGENIRCAKCLSGSGHTS